MSRAVNWNSVFKICILVNVQVSVIESDEEGVLVDEVGQPEPGKQTSATFLTAS